MKILDRKELEGLRYSTDSLSAFPIYELIETALALYDQTAQLLKSGISLEFDNARLMDSADKLFVERNEALIALDVSKGEVDRLMDENERLKGIMAEVRDDIDHIANLHFEKVERLEAENARLREEVQDAKTTLNNYRNEAEFCEKYKAENARMRSTLDGDIYLVNKLKMELKTLRAVVEALKRIRHLCFIPNDTKEGDIDQALEAALEKVKEGE